MLGGVLIQKWGWPAVFWFNIPVGLVGIVLALTLVRGRRPRPAADEALDWPGVGLFSAGLFCLTLALIQGNDWGWTSAAVLVLSAGAAAFLATWVWWELRTPSPLFDLRLFRNRTFAAASAAMVTVDTAMMGTSFMLVIFMIAMMDYSELKAGLAITTLPAAGLLLTPVSGWLVDRLGPRLLAVSGALLSAAGLVALGYLFTLGAAQPGALALGARRRRPRAQPAGAHRLRHERRARRRARRRCRHAQHGAATRLPARRRHPGGRLRHTMHVAVNHAADQGQALTRAQTGLSPATKHSVVKALDQARTINATAGISELRKVAHPIAESIGGNVGFVEGLVLLQLKDRLESTLWDDVAAAFRWPLFVAAIAALIGAVAGALLPRRLPRRGP